MRHLFFLGNKRSGTTAVVNALNTHPQLFITGEAHVAHIAHLAHWGLSFRNHHLNDRPPDEFVADFVFPAIGAEFMIKVGYQSIVAELDIASRINGLIANYHDALVAMTADGTAPYWAHLAGPIPRDYEVCGDKNPTVDLDYAHMLIKHLPSVQFLHIHRHPSFVIPSMQQAGFHGWWRDSTELMLHQWAMNEIRALEAPGDVLHVPYDLLVDAPQHFYDRLCRWLGVEPITVPNRPFRPNSAPIDLPDIPDVRRVLKELGY